MAEVVAMGERYAFGVDEPWKAWVAYAKAGWDTITRRGKLTKVEQIFRAKFERFFWGWGVFFPWGWWGSKLRIQMKDYI